MENWFFLFIPFLDILNGLKKFHHVVKSLFFTPGKAGARASSDEAPEDELTSHHHVEYDPDPVILEEDVKPAEVKHPKVGLMRQYSIMYV